MGGTVIRSEPSYIPWTKVQHWTEARGIFPDDAALLDHCIRVLDADYITWWREVNKVTPDANK